MGKSLLIKLCFLAVITVLFLLPSVSLTQQTCNQKGRITQNADVYAKIPKYVTGSGWQGNRVATLSSNTLVYICREEIAAFGFSSKVWVQIAFKNINNKWQYGWILKDNVSMMSSSHRKVDTSIGYSMLAIAYAAEPSETKPHASGGKDETPPPMPAPQDEEKSASDTRESSPVPLSDLGMLYWPLFVAMLLGMIAKAGVDLLDAPDKSLKKEHLRNAVVAVLVSPIVFLGFLSAGQFSASPQTFIVLWLLAFQNGFFWQTVLKRNVQKNNQENPSK